MAANPQTPGPSADSSHQLNKHLGCNGAELITCFACGDRYCPVCEECACDQLAEFLDELHKVQKRESRMPLLQHFIEDWDQ